MTRLERIAVELLRPCVFLPGSADKRFVKSLYVAMAYTPERPLTVRQSNYLFRLVLRYRGQVLRARLGPAAARPRGSRRWYMRRSAEG